MHPSESAERHAKARSIVGTPMPTVIAAAELQRYAFNPGVIITS
jgi:hypothetical protein